MKREFAGIGNAVFATTACAQSGPALAVFVQAEDISDMFEIESSKLALEKNIAADQAFAQRMVHDHPQTTEQLKHLVGGGKVKAQLPAELDDEHKQMLDKLRGESGGDFSKDYNQI